jgi:biopolymer transport protein ExbD
VKNRKARIVSDINVTSLVDVTLVLLIIFIISAPFMRAGVRVNLPRAEVRQPHPQQAILIAIDRAGQIFLNQEKIKLEDLAPRIVHLHSRSPDLPILIEGDSTVAYGQVVKIMDGVRRAGIENVGLVLETTGTAGTERQ